MLSKASDTTNFVFSSTTAWKVSIFRVSLVLIFPHSDWIWSISLQYLVRMRENMDQKNSEHEHFSCSEEPSQILHAKRFEGGVCRQRHCIQKRELFLKNPYRRCVTEFWIRFWYYLFKIHFRICSCIYAYIYL